MYGSMEDGDMVDARQIPRQTRFTIFTDSRVAIQWITTPNAELHSTVPWKLLEYTRSRLHLVCSHATIARLIWIPGHRGVQQHDNADVLARQAAESASIWHTVHYGVSLSALYTHIEKNLKLEWETASGSHIRVER